MTVAEPSRPIQGEDPIVSTLSVDNARIRTVIETFIGKLKEKLQQMDRSWANRDFDGLAELAHWLKGAGGTVGFHAFTEPAHALEQCAKQKHEARIGELIAELHGLNDRIVVAGPGLTRPQAQSAVPHDDLGDVPDRLVSRLLPGNPRMRPIIERFVKRLEEQLDAMDRAYEQGDFDGLADLAHWLKGAGGTVGFDAFTVPAQDLERLAKEGQADKVKAAMAKLRLLFERISMVDDLPETAQRKVGST